MRKIWLFVLMIDPSLSSLPHDMYPQYHGVVFYLTHQ